MQKKGDEVWTIQSYPEFREALRVMSNQSKLFKTIKAEMKHRGHWRQLPRGEYAKSKKS